MKALRIALVPAAIVLGVIAYREQLDGILGNTSIRALGTLAYAWAFVAAGLIAWSRRQGHRLGPMLVVVGFAMLLRQLRYSFDPLTFTVFYGLGDLPYALFTHAVLAYPTGRVTDRLERIYLKVAYPVVILFPLAILLFYEQRDLSGRLRYFDVRPHESLLAVSRQPDVVSALQQTYAVLAYGVLALAFIALIARRLVRATERTRRILAPLLVAAVVTALRAVFDSILTFTARPPEWVADNLFWWQVAGLVAVPLALLAGLLRARLARLTVAGLVVDLEDTPPQGIRDALARALDDPSLEVAFWLPERSEFVDADGRPTTLPKDGEDRAVTRLEHAGHTLAALVHDPSLHEEPKLVQAAGAAARMALENARLHAEVQAQLAKVKDSRARIVAAGDEQRRRIERDLHDGAQSRLVALALELKRAQRGVADPELERLLASTAEELQDAVQQLRELAQGLHPPLLVQSGLAVALAALADRAPVPVTVDADGERFAPEIEATAYFVVSEVLTNVAKHAQASRALVAAHRKDGTLVVAVEDDGVGGASADGGSGLRGLADRIEARGGRLTVESPPGGGTRVVAEIPMRVVIAEDSALFREGLARILADGGFEVTAQARDADELMRAIRMEPPDVAVVDVRMPPTHTDEGARAAREIRERHPEVGVLVLSQVVEAAHALDLFSDRPEGFGYLLKDRVLEIDDFLESVRRVGRGGSAIDPHVIAQLFGRQREEDGPLADLSPREREVLGLMAEGISNQGISGRLFLSPKTVETHVHAIFGKLRLAPAPDDHRRVLAVLAFLRN